MSSHVASIVLIHCDSTGIETQMKLTHDNNTAFYLPDVITPSAQVSRIRDGDHSSVRLELKKRYCLLSVHSAEKRLRVALGNIGYKLPLSTSSHKKSVLVTQEHRLITPNGQWQVLWNVADDLSTEIDPPLLSTEDYLEDEDQENTYDGEDEFERTIVLVPTSHGDALVDRRELSDVDAEENREPISIAEIRLSPVSSTQDETLQTALHTSEEHAQSSEELSNHDELKGTDPHPGSKQNECKEPIVMTQDDKSHPHLIKQASTAQQNSREGRVSGDDISKIIPITITEAKRDNMVSSLTKEDTSGQGIDPCSDGSTAASKSPAKEQDSCRLQIANYSALPLTLQPHQSDERLVSENETQQKRGAKVLKRGLAEVEQGSGPFKKRVRFEPTSIALTTFSDSEDQDTITVPPTLAAKRKRPGQVESAQSAQDWSPSPSRKLTSRPRPPPSHIVEVIIPPRHTSQDQFENAEAVPARKSVSSDCIGPRVVFGSSSAVSGNKKFKSTVGALGGKIVHDIHDADVLCIGRDKMKKTSKFVIAVATGKHIVTDGWLERAHVDQEFPKYEDFLPEDVEHEQEWGFSLKEAIERGRQGLKLLEGIHVHFTAQLRKDLGSVAKELKNVALTLGAASVQSALPKKGAQDPALVVGSTRNFDPDVATVKRLGHKLYKQDILTMAALRGLLELNSDEFTIDMSITG